MNRDLQKKIDISRSVSGQNISCHFIHMCVPLRGRIVIANSFPLLMCLNISRTAVSIFVELILWILRIFVRLFEFRSESDKYSEHQKRKEILITFKQHKMRLFFLLMYCCWKIWLWSYKLYCYYTQTISYVCFLLLTPLSFVINTCWDGTKI